MKTKNLLFLITLFAFGFLNEVAYSQPCSGTLTAGDSTICSGNSATLTLTLSGGGPYALQWTSSPTGSAPANDAAFNSPPKLAVVSPFVNTTYTVTITTSSAATCMASVSINVNPIPAAPIAAGATVCAGNTATLTATAPGAIYDWFMSPAGGVSLNTGAVYTTPVLAATTTYYVQSTQGGCAGPRTAVTVTVNSCTGIMEGNKELSVTMGPNPTSREITVNSGVEIIKSIEVYNILGEKVYDNKTYKSSSIKVDLSSQPKGIYFLKVSNGEKTITNKILKE